MDRYDARRLWIRFYHTIFFVYNYIFLPNSKFVKAGLEQVGTSIVGGSLRSDGCGIQLAIHWNSLAQPAPRFDEYVDLSIRTVTDSSFQEGRDKGPANKGRHHHHPCLNIDYHPYLTSRSSTNDIFDSLYDIKGASFKGAFQRLSLPIIRPCSLS